MWILTRAINEYDQEGEYFEACFEKEPTLQDLCDFFYKCSLEGLGDKDLMFLSHIKQGGGRRNSEDLWYYLTDVKPGEIYQSH